MYSVWLRNKIPDVMRNGTPLWRYVLWPLSLMYGLGITLRNATYRWGLRNIYRSPLPGIGVGNLSAGGTGKTPMVEWLLSRLTHHRPALVSRGYGRHTKGLICWTGMESAADVGDEVYQILKKFPAVPGAVSEKRSHAMRALEANNNVGLLILDDAFQHQSVALDVHLLLTTYQRPYTRDLLLPAGYLREPRREARRAHIIILTKCPETLNKKEASALRREINPRPEQQLFFSSIRYGKLQNTFGEEWPRDQREATIVTGIAQPAPLLEHLHQRLVVKEHWRYPDHHQFSRGEVQRILRHAGPVITTEKDWVRLLPALRAANARHVYYLPVETRILFAQEAELLRSIEENLPL